jgi:hypothetical protein
LRQLDLLQRIDLEPAELEHEQMMARERLEGEMALETSRQEFLLYQQKQEADFHREQQELDDIARRERALQDTQNRLSIELQQAQTQAQIDQIRREQDQADGELGILLLEKMKAVRRKDEEERKMLDLRVAEQQMLLTLQAERERTEMRMAERAQEQQFELDWMERLKGMPPAELVVAAKDAERAQIIRDMQQTEIMQGMTEQQILAMATENSPQAAQALAEIARAAAEGELNSEQREMYERLLGQAQQLADQRAAEADRLDRIGREQADRQERMMYKALDTQRDAAVDVAKATSQPQQPPTVIVTGTGGTTQTISGGVVQGGAFRCPNCSEVVEEDANFCPNCRHQLRGGVESE